MMWQCRFTEYNKCTTLVQDAGGGRWLCMCGCRDYVGTVLSAQYCCGPKTDLKIKCINK